MPNQRIVLSPFSVDLLDRATYNTKLPPLHYTGDVELIGEDRVKIPGFGIALKMPRIFSLGRKICASSPLNVRFCSKEEAANTSP
jgi:hypothetical protein